MCSFVLFTLPQGRPVHCGSAAWTPKWTCPLELGQGLLWSRVVGGRELCCLCSLLCPQFLGGSPSVPTPWMKERRKERMAQQPLPCRVDLAMWLL